MRLSGYVSLSFFFALLLLAMTRYGDYVMSFFSKFVNCPVDRDMSICMGISVVVR